jgi:hypothetical protein
MGSPPTTSTSDFLIFEAFLVHYRNLLVFFNKASANDDVLAVRYAPGWTHTVPAKFEHDKQRCNRLLAHLSYRRSGYRIRNEMVWPDVPGKAQYIEDLFAAFLQSLTPERYEWFPV